MERDEFLRAERDRVSKRTTLTVACADILRWLGGLPTIPDEVLTGTRPLLEEAKQEQEIRDFMLLPTGHDLLVEVTTLGRGLHDPGVHGLIARVFSAALARAKRVGAYAPSGVSIFSISAQRTGSSPFACVLSTSRSPSGQRADLHS